MDENYSPPRSFDPAENNHWPDTSQVTLPPGPKGQDPALKTEAEDDAIEPEIVGGPSWGAHGGHKPESAMGRFSAFIFKLKMAFAAAIGLIALTLIIIGAVLTSTVIGAVLGIPLMLLGVFLIWLLFKALTFSGKNFAVFSRGQRHR